MEPGHGRHELEHVVELVADVCGTVGVCPGRGEDEHGVGEHDGAQSVCLVRCADDGVLGRVSFDGESVLDDGTGVWVVARLTLAGESCSRPLRRRAGIVRVGVLSSGTCLRLASSREKI